MTPLEGDAGTIQVVWSAQLDQVALLANDLADPGPDRAYALWLLSSGVATPAGLFQPDDGQVRTVLPVANQAPAQWACDDRERYRSGPAHNARAVPRRRLTDTRPNALDSLRVHGPATAITIV